MWPLMRKKKAEELRQVYNGLSDFDKRYVARIMKDSAEIATPGKMAAVIICGVLALVFLVFIIGIIIGAFAEGEALIGILFMIPAFFLAAAVFSIYVVFVVKNRTTIEGATKCLLQERKSKNGKASQLAKKLREKNGK